jgi:hypothetical protein
MQTTDQPDPNLLRTTRADGHDQSGVSCVQSSHIALLHRILHPNSAQTSNTVFLHGFVFGRKHVTFLWARATEGSKPLPPANERRVCSCPNDLRFFLPNSFFFVSFPPLAWVFFLLFPQVVDFPCTVFASRLFSFFFPSRPPRQPHHNRHHG